MSVSIYKLANLLAFKIPVSIHKRFFIKHSQAAKNQDSQTHLWLLNINYKRYCANNFKLEIKGLFLQ